MVGLDPGALGFESAKVKRPCSSEALPISRRLTNGSHCLARVPGANWSLFYRLRQLASSIVAFKSATKGEHAHDKLSNWSTPGGWEVGCLDDLETVVGAAARCLDSHGRLSSLSWGLLGADPVSQDVLGPATTELPSRLSRLGSVWHIRIRTISLKNALQQQVLSLRFCRKHPIWPINGPVYLVFTSPPSKCHAKQQTLSLRSPADWFNPADGLRSSQHHKQNLPLFSRIRVEIFGISNNQYPSSDQVLSLQNMPVELCSGYWSTRTCWILPNLDGSAC